MLQSVKDIIRRIRIALLHLHCNKLSDVSVATGTAFIIAPHPDDEVMGCGGLIQRLVKQGCNVHVVLMTGGEGSHQDCCDTSKSQIKDARRSLCTDIDRQLGVDNSHIHSLDYADGGILAAHNETERLQALISKLKPNTIFVPHWGEGWPDHVNTRSIIRSIASHDATIYEYCVWLWYYNVWRLDWNNARVLSMSEEEHKMKCLCVDGYVTPLAPCGKPWSGVLPRVLLDALRWRKELFFVSVE